MEPTAQNEIHKTKNIVSVILGDSPIYEKLAKSYVKFERFEIYEI